MCAGCGSRQHNAHRAAPAMAAAFFCGMGKEACGPTLSLRERIRQVESRPATCPQGATTSSGTQGLKGGGGDNGLLQSAEEIPNYMFPDDTIKNLD